MLKKFRMIRGDRQRLPSWDETEYIQLDTLDSTDIDETDVPDLTDRTVDLSLVTKVRGGDRIDLSNAVEIGDPTAGEVAITLEESDTAVPIDGIKTNLYGEFRISGGTEDPTTAGTIKIELYPSRHDVEGEAQLLPYGGLQNPATADLNMAGHGITGAGLLEGSWDHLITDVADIEELDALVSVGDTVRIKQPDTPYVLSSQPTLDTSHIRLEFEDRFAKNGEPILKVADETPIRGLEVGEGGSPIEDITIINYGYHGNKDNQTHDAENCDALRFGEVTNFEVRHFYARDAYPWHEHNTGGSAITVSSDNADDMTFVDCRVHNIGDRGLQIQGTNGYYRHIVGTDGYDRLVTFRAEAAHHYVNGLHASNHVDTSMVGFAPQGATNPPYDIHIINATWYNLPRGFGNVSGVHDASFTGIRGYNDESETSAGIPYNYAVRFNHDLQNVSLTDMKVVTTGDLMRAIQCDTANTGGGKTIENVEISDVNLRVGGETFRGVNVLNEGYEFNDIHVELPNATSILHGFYAEAPTTVRGITVSAPNGTDININSAATNVHISDAEYNTIIDDGTGTVINGEAVESAAAETPQGDYPQGAFVDFTDSDDGSGTGYYRAKRDGTFVQVA